MFEMYPTEEAHVAEKTHFPDYEVLPAINSQRHWASKIRARPVATPVRVAALPATFPYQTQAPVRAVALYSDQGSSKDSGSTSHSPVPN
ncbi:Hypothetical predicted protein [Mytilus galloprovincialis]|uniref:Uncharacterized protein n=1 Tax=Mytilus galloprovincialis TaxID=29158 RepID=A0A8B6EKK6_MYTGA|nr:Hypothetical predicted protein [Mytilus galloprovincialis]